MNTCFLMVLSELYTLLLEDILVLLQKQDERLILKCHSKNLAGTADTKHIYSPIIKHSTVLVRSVATGSFKTFSAVEKIMIPYFHCHPNLISQCMGTCFVNLYRVQNIIILMSRTLFTLCLSDNKSFFVLSMSENGPQIYELMAPTVSDKKTWD